MNAHRDDPKEKRCDFDRLGDRSQAKARIPSEIGQYRSLHRRRRKIASGKQLFWRFTDDQKWNKEFRSSGGRTILSQSGSSEPA